MIPRRLIDEENVDAAIAEDVQDRLDERVFDQRPPTPQPCHECEALFAGSHCPICKAERPAYTMLKTMAEKVGALGLDVRHPNGSMQCTVCQRVGDERAMCTDERCALLFA